MSRTVDSFRGGASLGLPSDSAGAVADQAPGIEAEIAQYLPHLSLMGDAATGEIAPSEGFSDYTMHVERGCRHSRRRGDPERC